jgi:hypothetical protein
MDNHQRRVGYVAQRYGLTITEAHNRLSEAYGEGTENALLTPAQRRRTRHNQGGYKKSDFRGSVIMDEVQLRTDAVQLTGDMAITFAPRTSEPVSRTPFRDAVIRFTRPRKSGRRAAAEQARAAVKAGGELLVGSVTESQAQRITSTQGGRRKV